jgi:phosphate transport system permease protein
MTIVSVVLIIYFIFQAGLPFLLRKGVLNIVFGQSWYPSLGKFGIWPMIVGTLIVTAGAIVIGVPLGLGTAICLEEFAPRRVAAIARSAIELLAGIPSVVYGFYGLIVLVPIVRSLFGGTGFGVITASLVIGIMILPTIISVSQDSIRAVPREYREGSLALGAAKWQTVRRVTMPAASSGILAGVVLGIGRAIGETMAVIMVVGGAPQIPHALTDMTRTLTANIALEMGYAAGEHREALFATGVVLFIFIIALNLTLQLVRRKGVR